MSEATKVLISVGWDVLEEIDRRAEACGMSRSKFLVTMALLPRPLGEIELRAAAKALLDGLTKFNEVVTTKKET